MAFSSSFAHRRPALSLLLLFLGTLIGTSQATYFQFSSSTCTEGKFSLSSESFTCDSGVGSGACAGGNTLTGTGTVNAVADLPDNYSLEVRVCKFRIANWNLICPITRKLDYNLCDIVTSGNNCPAAGSYGFEFEEALPGDGPFRAGSGYKIYLEADVLDEDNNDQVFEKCTLIFQAVSGYSMSWSASMAGAAAVVTLLGLGAFVHKKRRRYRNVVSLEDQDDEEHVSNNSSKATDFVEMTDASISQRGAVV